MIGSTETLLLAKKLSSLVEGNVPLDQALKTLAKREAKLSSGKVLRSISDRIQEGISISDAFEAEGKYFPEAFLETIRRGETTGDFATFLRDFSVQWEPQMEMESAFNRTLEYHAILLILFTASILLLTYQIAPVFQHMFMEMGGSLPGPTRVFFALAKQMQIIFPVVGVVLAVGIFLYRFGKNRDRLCLYLPVYGRLYRKVLTANWLKTVAIFLHFKLPLDQAFETASKTGASTWLETNTHEMVSSIRQGNSLQDSIRDVRILPAIICELLSFGETHGHFTEALTHSADLLKEQTESEIALFRAIFEPTLALCFSLFWVGAIMSFYLPIFALASMAGS